MSDKGISPVAAAVSFGPGAVLVLVYLLAPVDPGNRLVVAVCAFAFVEIARDILIPPDNVLAGHMFDIPWLFYTLLVAAPGLAIAFQDDRIIKAGPSAYFVLVALLSARSAFTDQPRLQRFARMESLRAIGREGWRSLTLFAAISCMAMALINELVWRTTSTGFWLAFQLFGWLLIKMGLMIWSMRIFDKHDFRKKPRSESEQKA